MAGLADGSLYLGGGDPFCVLSWSVSGFSWSDTQPARYRRLHPVLQSGCVHYVTCSVHRSSLLINCTTALGCRGRAPATQVACLRCWGDAVGTPLLILSIA